MIQKQFAFLLTVLLCAGSANRAFAVKPILITGVNRGLGLHLCRIAARNNLPIIVSSRRESDTVALLKREGIPFLGHIAIDFGAENPESVYRKVKALGPLSGMIHSSSPYSKAGVKDSNPEDFHMFGSFLANTMAISKAVSEQVDNTGKAVYVGAMLGQLGRIKYTPFSVYKLSIRGMVEGLNKEKLDATYINLGTVRPDAETKELPDKALPETYVAEKIMEAYQAPAVSEQIDLFAKDDLKAF